MSRGVEGTRQLRDTRFVTGRADFADDDRTARRVHAAFVRCPYAHARIATIDLRRALATAGVLGAWTGRDLERAGVRPIPVAWQVEGFFATPHAALATDHVRHVGEAVAIVVAESAHVARDAADRVEVEYAPLPAVGDARAALAAGAPLVHDEAAGNVAVEWRTGDEDTVARAFTTAAHIVEQHVTIPRTAAVPLEPRACTAAFDPATRTLLLHSPAQSPHVNRTVLSIVLGVPEHRVRVVTGDTGGAFGSRLSLGAEDVAVCFASMQLGQPVHWTGVRREAFHSDGQGRDHQIDIAMAFDADLRIRALRLRSIANLGAYAGLIAPALPSVVFAAALPGPYAVPAIDARVTAVYTNTVPVDAVRGAGRQEACFAIERLIDIAARKLQIEPAELRLRNLETAANAGAVEGPRLVDRAAEALGRALEFANVSELRAEQQQTRDGGRYLGMGMAVYVDACAPGPGFALEVNGAAIGLLGRANVRVHPTGTVTIVTDVTDQGQAHATVLASIVVDVLGIDADSIAVESGDTTGLATGAGTFLGRGVAFSARAVRRAAEIVRSRAERIAALHFNVPADTIELKGAVFQVRDRADQSLSIAQVARLAQHANAFPDGGDMGLEASASFDAQDWSRTTGAHIAIVDVDAETGNTTLLRYIAVDDVGQVLDQDGVRAMLEGGIAHGIGQIMMEKVAYDENGQLLTPSLMDYALPRIDGRPVYDVRPLESRGTTAEARSAGNAGAIASPAAVANAVLDALAPLGVTHIDPPLTPSRIWEVIRSARGEVD